MYRYASLLTKFHNPSLALDVIRIYLGVALGVRGVIFILDSAILTELVADPDRDWFMPAMVMHYVVLAHVAGGILLALGFLTRIAALVQIPVLVGAVFIVHLKEGLLIRGQSLELSALILFLLIVVFVFGPGKVSLDFLITQQAARQAER